MARYSVSPPLSNQGDQQIIIKIVGRCNNQTTRHSQRCHHQDEDVVWTVDTVTRTGTVISIFTLPPTWPVSRVTRTAGQCHEVSLSCPHLILCLAKILSFSKTDRGKYIFKRVNLPFRSCKKHISCLYKIHACFKCIELNVLALAHC